MANFTIHIDTCNNLRPGESVCVCRGGGGIISNSEWLLDYGEHSAYLLQLRDYAIIHIGYGYSNTQCIGVKSKRTRKSRKI